MLKTPSKFLSRPFLEQLTENRFISPRGIEYCEAEVIELLHEKQHRLALQEFDQELKAKAKEAEKLAEQDPREVMLKHQDRMFQRLGLLRDLAEGRQVVTPSEFSEANTIFQLPGKSDSVEVDTASRKTTESVGGKASRQRSRRSGKSKQQPRGTKMKTYKGHRIRWAKDYPLQQIKKDRKSLDKWLADFNRRLKDAK